MRQTLVLSSALFTLLQAHVLLAQPEPPPPEPPPPVEPEPAPEPPPPPEPPAAPAPPPVQEMPTTAPEWTPVPAEAAPTPPPAKKDEGEAPTKIHVGKEGFFQPSATLQGWFWLTDQARLSTETRPRRTTTFRLRRAELKIKGEIVPKFVAYQVMIDPAKALEFNKKTVDVQGQEPAPTTAGNVTVEQPNGSTSIMQDFFITFLSDYAEVSLGQFKVPLSWEGYNSASKLIFPERAMISRKYGDRRDLGLRVEKKLGDYFYYSAGVFNGDGQNRPDSNNQKDVALRLEAYPIKEAMIGGVYYTSVGQRNEATTKDRMEADARIDIADVLFQAEYIRGVDGPANGTRVTGQGFYGALGYTLMDRLQPLVRVGYLDPNTKKPSSLKEDAAWAYEADVNYYIQKNEAKLQLSYSLFDFDKAKKRTEVILAAQASF